MPFTLSHPAAILPLRRLTPRVLNLPALVIGSVSPDFLYYVGGRLPLSATAHTVLGTFTVCLPLGLVALGLFHLLRRPCVWLLPQPHRAALLPLCAPPTSPPPTRRAVLRVLAAALSVLIGAWTHILWDGFTHPGTPITTHLPILNATVLHIGATPLPLSYLLQHGSTLLGGALLLLVYGRWLRRQPPTSPATAPTERDGWRYRVLALIVLASMALAVWPAWQLATHYPGYTAVRVFLFRLWIYTVPAAVLLGLGVALLVARRHRFQVAADQP